MPGMMTDDLKALNEANGAAFDRMFLTMMVQHHEGAIEMAKREQADGKNPDAISLAEQIQTAQTSEITKMTKLLEALFSTGAAVPLAVFSAIISDRIRTLGLQVPGRLIALVGGAGAATILALSGLTSLALLGNHATENLPLLQFGQRLTVALGGTGFAAFIGLLVAGVAVPGLLGHLLPRPLAIAGLIIAILAELSLTTILTDAANPLLPVARFGSIIFLLAAAFTLRSRAN